jgi:hypothetical protein
MPHDPTSAAWVAAAGRLLNDGTGTPLRRLNLFIAMYNHLEAENLLPIVAAAISDLEYSEIEGIEAEQCAELIEALTASLLPSEIQEQAQRVVCSSTKKMLSDYGDALSLDEIESVTAALAEYGIDEDGAVAAADRALREYIENLDQNLHTVGSLFELKNVREQLDKLLDDYGQRDNQINSIIDREFRLRHEQLNEEEDRDDEYLRSGRSDSVGRQISNDHIRSMFGHLRP